MAPIVFKFNSQTVFSLCLGLQYTQEGNIKESDVFFAPFFSFFKRSEACTKETGKCTHFCLVSSLPKCVRSHTVCPGHYSDTQEHLERYIICISVNSNSRMNRLEFGGHRSKVAKALCSTLACECVYKGMP